MSKLDREELPGDLADLLSEGRPGIQVPDADRQSLLASLGPMMGPFGPGGGSPPPGEPPAPPSAQSASMGAPSTAPTHSLQALLGSKAAAWVGGIIVGSAVTVAAQSVGPVPPSTEAVALISSTSVPPPAEPSSSPSTDPSEPTVLSPESLPMVSPPTSRTAPSSPPESRDQSLRAERELLDVARTAVARGDGQGALSVLRQHANRFPKGRLAEEREALRIQALLLDGRGDEAKARASEFKQEHPDSLMLPGIAPALSSELR
jgi:hypothetical protein